MKIRNLFYQLSAIIALTAAFAVPETVLYPAATLAAPAPAVIAQSAQTDATYIVQRGDTLSAIARRYDTTVQAIVSYNGLRTTTIYVGQRLLIPGVQPGPVYPITYVVQRGDTLNKIAARYDTTVEALMQVNNLQSDRIYVGQRLTISVAADPNAPMIEYTVQRGDTLSAIAQRYQVTIDAIRATNGLTSSTIFVGQRLLIPQSLGYPTPTPEPHAGTTRIQFAPGAISATVKGRLVGNNRDQYLLQASAGQELSIELIADGAANFSVTGVSDGQPLKRLENEERSWRGRLPSTQDYLIQIASPQPNNPGYTLIVTIPPVTPPARERIQFAPGAVSATVTGTVTDPAHREYLLAAQAGQVMWVALTSDNDLANFSVQGLGDGQMVKNFGETTWNGVLPATQDYLITILTMEFSSTNYSLFVEISPHQVGGTPERIQFAPGAISATVANYVSMVEPHSYLLEARAGQQMTVSLTVDNANAYIKVLNPSGDNMAGSDGPIHNWTGVLPVNGDYIVEVLNPGTGLANFTLTVTIQ